MVAAASGQRVYVWAVARNTSPDMPAAITSASGQHRTLHCSADVLSFRWFPDSYRLLTIQSDGSATVHTIESCSRLAHYSGLHDAPVSAVELCSTGSFFTTGAADGTVALLTMRTHGPQEVLFQHHSPTSALYVSPDGRTIVGGDDDGRVRMWSTYEGKCTARMHDAQAEIYAVAMSPDGRWLCAAGSECIVYM